MTTARDGRYEVTPASALWVCVDCGAVVPVEARAIHDEWHERLALRPVVAAGCACGEDRSHGPHAYALPKISPRGTEATS